MAIRFACACGKVFNVRDEHAGKRTKCPACGVSTVVPIPDVELDVEVVEELDVEVVEEPAPTKRRPAKDDEDDRPRRGGKRRRRKPDRGGAMARMYEKQHDADMRRYGALARTADRDYGRDEDDREGHGWTMFGVHVTAGVLSGAGLLLIGLLSMALIAIFKDDEDIIIGPRIFIGAIVCTALGVIVLVKSLVFGEED